MVEDENMDDDEQEGKTEDVVAEEPVRRWQDELARHGTDAGLTFDESVKLCREVERGEDTDPLLDEEVPYGEFEGLTRREAYAKKHRDDVFPELPIHEEVELRKKFFGERPLDPNGQWPRDASGCVLPRIGIDRTLSAFDTRVPAGMWRGHIRRDVLMMMEVDADNKGIEALRPIVEREIASASEYTQEAVNEMIDTYLSIVFVNAVKYNGEYEPWEQAEKELEVRRVHNSLINRLLVGSVTVDEATTRMDKLGRDFSARLGAIVEEDAVVRQTAFDLAEDMIRRKVETAPKPLGGEHSTRGEIKDTLIKFYNKGGQPKDAWRPGDLFVYGVDKSNSYRVYREWLAKQRGN